MYILKQQLEDFIVKEISNVKVNDQGNYTYFKLKKRNRNTLDVIKEIAKQLNLKEKQVGFAGSKDKNAITEQLISIKNVSKKKISSIKIENADLKLVGYGNEPISLGGLEGNGFKIIVRNLEEFSIDKVTFTPNYIPNYFDEQRFSLHNLDIGRHLVKKEFKDAVRLINDTRCKKHLEKHERDFIGALKKLPLRLLRMYVNAYQSYLWNRTLAEHLRENGKILKEVTYSLGKFVFVNDFDKFLDLEVPLIGFGIEIKNTKIKETIKNLMKKENLDFADFVIKQIPELSLEGELRKAFVEVKDLKIGKVENDELNLGKKKVKLSFSLGKGSYATMAVRSLINSI